ncbi:MAG: murein transglycosylase A [Gemmatimonadota bacterium]
MAAALLLAACVTPPTPVTPPAIKTVTEARYEPVGFDALPALADSDLVSAWPALLASCRVLERGAHRSVWAVACSAARQTDASRAGDIRATLMAQFQPWRVLRVTREEAGANGAAEPREIEVADRGRITGYYEPQLAGSRSYAPPFVHPLYRVPDDLLTIDLASLFPELAGKRVRGRLDGRRVVPYWSRADIEDRGRLRGAELLWVDDEIDAFFLQVQGSGRVQFPDGSLVRIGYADTNGQPYHSIGRILVERGELKLEEASLQGIRAWALAHPARVPELLNQNPSYVFFRELPLGDPNAGPIGAMNIALTPGYSVAADPRFIPLGGPLVVSTVHPSLGSPLVRLMLAQDVGGAIRGPLRFDFFWGFGRTAGELAGRQRNDVQAWLLLPNGARPEQLLAR